MVPGLGMERVFPERVAPVKPWSNTLQVMVLLVALAGSTVPERVSEVPAVAEVGRPVMSVTGTKAALTVIVKSCV